MWESSHECCSMAAKSFCVHMLCICLHVTVIILIAIETLIQSLSRLLVTQNGGGKNASLSANYNYINNF